MAGDVDVVAAVRALSLELERWRAQFGRRHGLAENDTVILSHLAAHDGRLLPRDLARLMDLRTGTVTAMLDRLETAGFIARLPNPHDRRSTIIEVTPDGRRIMAGAFDHLTDVLAGTPARERARLAAAVDEVTGVISAVNQRMASGDGR